VYRVEDGTPVADDSPSHPSRTTDISPEGRNKLVVSELVGEWSLAGETARLFGSHSERVIALDVSRNGRHFASHGRSAVLWEIGSDFAASTPLAQGIGADASWNVAIAPDGGSFVVSGDNVALFWLDDSVGNDPPPPSIDCLSPDWAFSPDGELLAGSRYGSTVEIRSAADFRLLREVEANNCGGGAAFSPDGKLLATGSLELFETDTWTKLWDRSNGRMPEPFTETAVEFSPDGRELVTTPCGFNEPCTSERYAASDGTYLGVLPALQGDRVRYSPEGHWVVSQGRALHLPSGRSLELDPDATVAAFTTDGDIIAGLVDGSLVRYCRDDD
jgi:WD40 repeat protein